MSRNTLAVSAVLGIIAVVAVALIMGVEKGTPLFQAIGGILIIVALGFFFFGKQKAKK